jgi:hypothetical protein
VLGNDQARAPDSLDAMSARPAQRPGDRYGDPKFRRTGLAPGLLAAIVLLVGLALLDNDAAYLVIRYVVAILAIIVGFFAFQAKQWWWMPPMAAIAVIWNPVVPFDQQGPLSLSGQWWVAGQYVAVIAFVAAGILIKVPATQEDTRR